ncbi:MAG: ABC transporter substrate-binding protein [Clostridia bacterium]|nr:ABC transporter substrate-binding protein [Clostridia bacterium]
MKKFICVLLAALMCLSLAAAAADEAGIRIGIIGPFTGPAAAYGTAVRDAALIAAEEINAEGGLQIIIDAQDDEHNTEKSVNAYNTLKDNGVQLILGTVTTSPCIAVSVYAAEDRILMLTPSASSPDVLESDNNTVFQVCFTDPAQGALSAQYIAEKGLAKKVGVIYNNGDAYSTGIYETFAEEAKTVGLELVAESTFTDADTDFSVQVAAMKNAGAELVFLPIYYTPAAMIFNAAKNADYAPVFFGVDGMDGILTLEGFDKSLAEGVYLLTPFSADADNETTKNFVAKYTERYGSTPNQFAADAYDGVGILYVCCVSAGITPETPAAEACELVMNELLHMQYDGLTGTMTWNEDGTVTKSPKAVIIKDGAYVSAP